MTWENSSGDGDSPEQDIDIKNDNMNDGIFPREVTLTPPPKDTYVKDQIGFLGYSC